MLDYKQLKITHFYNIRVAEFYTSFSSNHIWTSKRSTPLIIAASLLNRKKAVCKLRPLPFENVWFCAFNYTVVVKNKQTTKQTTTNKQIIQNKMSPTVNLLRKLAFFFFLPNQNVYTVCSVAGFTFWRLFSSRYNQLAH